MEIYPNELLYSYVSRYHLLSGRTNFRKTGAQLFGRSNRVERVIDLPSQIGILHERALNSLSVDRIINLHTLYPYYESFLTLEQSQVVYRRMEKLEKGAAPHRFAGLASSMVKSNKKLKLCPVCIKEDIDRVGEPYWHREHQLPGVIVCPTHNVHLHDQCPACEATLCDLNKNGYTIAPTFCINGHTLTDGRLNNNYDYFLIAAESMRFLDRTYNVTLPQIKEKFPDLLIESGLKRFTKNILPYDTLLEKFNERFPNKTLEAIGVPVPTTSRKWIQTVFSQTTTKLHPLCFILMMLFLSKTIQHFLKAAKYEPFPGKPWPCLNVTCKQYNKNIISDVTIVVGNKVPNKGYPRGTFTCNTCGFAYTRTGPDKTKADRYKYESIRDTGPIWENELDRLIKQRHTSVKGIARRLNVGETKIRRRIEGKELHFRKSSAEIIAEKRAIVMDLINDNPTALRKEIRSMNTTVYNWLKYNDKAWFKENMPPIILKDFHTKRTKLLQLIAENPTANRKELLKISGGVMNWLYRNDRVWLEGVLPINQRVDCEKRRRSFEELLKNCPNASRTELRKLGKGFYRWLYRNDREWLEERLAARAK